MGRVRTLGGLSPVERWLSEPSRFIVRDRTRRDDHALAARLALSEVSVTNQRFLGGLWAFGSPKVIYPRSRILGASVGVAMIHKIYLMKNQPVGVGGRCPHGKTPRATIGHRRHQLTIS